MIYFSTRAKARAFAKGKKTVHDLGKDRVKRWGVKVV